MARKTEHFPVYTDTGKRGRQKERFYGKYTLIIKYLSKGNNFSQVATLCIALQFERRTISKVKKRNVAEIAWTGRKQNYRR